MQNSQLRELNQCQSPINGWMSLFWDGNIHSGACCFDGKISQSVACKHEFFQKMLSVPLTFSSSNYLSFFISFSIF
jgi:hypothetical protein